MLEITFLQGLWFVLIAILIVGYFILDGLDLGIGVLYPFIQKNEYDKALMRRAVGPIWDGNEVWLLTAGGALFAAFPPAYATSFSGFYLAIMLVLFGLIARAVSLEFRHHDPALKKIWDNFFFIGSLLPALLLGVAVGNIVGGIELNAHGDYIGGFFALLNPFALVCGVLGLVQMILLGSSWLTVKTQTNEPIYKRAQIIRTFSTIALVVFTLIAMALFITTPQYAALGSGNKIVGFIFLALIALCVLVSFALSSKGKDLPNHIALSVICVGLVGMAAAGIFPNLIPATDPALSITVANAASSEYALGAMSIIVCIGLPLVLLYHVVIYRTFRGKITKDDLTDY